MNKNTSPEPAALGGALIDCSRGDIVLFFLDGSLKNIVPVAMMGLAFIEYVAVGAVVNKVERQAQRDRG